MYNRITLIGNLTNDIELRETPSGVPVVRFSLGVGRKQTQDGERVTDFFDCTAWRGAAEVLARFGKKGHKLCVEGTVQIRTYEDNNGIKRKVYDVIVSDFELLTPRVQTNETNETAKKPKLVAMDDDSDIPF
jgi:single-strand DNA-binding protein